MLVKNQTTGIDIYSKESLLNPYDNYKILRDMGSVTYLEKQEMYVAPRYQDVKFALENPELFISGNGVTMNYTVNNALRGIGLCSDGDEHRRIRKVESRPLNPRALRELRDSITSEAEVVVDRIMAAKSFDVVTDLAQALPLSIVSNLVGVPEEGRERMLDWAAGNFNAFGPASERTSASMGVFGEMVNYAMTQCVPGKLKPGSWAAMLHDAADNGEISSDEARLMALSYLAPSLDTTIFAISNGIALFAANPDQWDIVREHPNSIPNAINEILRLESPIQGFSRFAIRDHKFDEGTVPANSRIILLFGSANRDERHWVDPERFDVLRERAGEHLAFGYGEHMCIGMNLARMEISALLTALARKVSRFTLNSPERVINSTLRGFAHLNVTVD